MDTLPSLYLNKYYVFYICITFNSLKQTAGFSLRVFSKSMGGSLYWSENKRDEKLFA